MIDIKPRISWPVRLAAVVVALGIGWLTLAYNSGQFRGNGAAWAVAPGEVTRNGFSEHKKFLQLPDSMVAYIDVGQGPPLIILHGCPFSAFKWQAVLPQLARHYRVIAPDLRGLGDTPVRLNDDYRLATSVTMVRQLLSHLEITSARFVGHDHGAAVLQLLMQADPALIERSVITNAEACDQWPSKPETAILKAIVHPVTGPLMDPAHQQVTLGAVPAMQGIHYLKNSKHMPFEEEHVEYTKAVLDFMGKGDMALHAKTSLAAARNSAVLR